MNGLASIDLTKPFSAITGTISVLTGIGKTIGWLFGFGGADYSGYEEMKSRYDNLISVWDTLISKKMEYIDIDYGVEAQKAADEAAKLVETQIQRQRQLANMLAGSGASIGSHSLGYRINDRMTQNDWANLSDLVGQRVSGIYDVLSLDADVIGKVLQDEKFVSVLSRTLRNTESSWKRSQRKRRKYLPVLVLTLLRTVLLICFPTWMQRTRILPKTSRDIYRKQSFRPWSLISIRIGLRSCMIHGQSMGKVVIS